MSGRRRGSAGDGIYGLSQSRDEPRYEPLTERKLRGLALTPCSSPRGQIKERGHARICVRSYIRALPSHRDYVHKIQIMPAALRRAAPTSHSRECGDRLRRVLPTDRGCMQIYSRAGAVRSYSFLRNNTDADGKFKRFVVLPGTLRGLNGFRCPSLTPLEYSIRKYLRDQSSD